jgi:hypothetical protein
MEIIEHDNQRILSIGYKLVKKRLPIEDALHYKDEHLKKYLKAWKEIKKGFQIFHLKNKFGYFAVTMDCSEIICALENVIKDKDVEKGCLSNEETITLYINILIPLKENVKLEDCEMFQDLYTHDIRNFIYNFFFIANISCPGCYNPYMSNFFAGEKPVFGEETLFLSASIFSHFLETDKYNWPLIKNLNVNKSWLWFQSLNVGQQMAKNSTERAIFALLNVCLESIFSPSGLIWLAYALEGLYDTPKVLIHDFLQKRIFLVLGEPVAFKKDIKKQISDFYNKRSSYVHGGLNVSHPAANESVTSDEDKFDDFIFDLMKHYKMPAKILVSTLQKLIINNWQELAFKENYKGIKFSKEPG